MNLRFENDVKTYGTETLRHKRNLFQLFENDVKTYGTETPIRPGIVTNCLRMM